MTAERTFLAEMDGSCQVPIAGYATISSDQKEMRMPGLIMTPDGKERFEYTMNGTDPVEFRQNSE